jgi:hypothetical protein
MYGLNLSLAASGAYLRYLSSVTDSGLKPESVNCRLAQIWINVHLENHINDLKKSEKNGLPLNRQRRAIPTIARDYVLQLFIGANLCRKKQMATF